jgi:hypothetical protein
MPPPWTDPTSARAAVQSWAPAAVAQAPWADQQAAVAEAWAAQELYQNQQLGAIASQMRPAPSAADGGMSPREDPS